MKPVSRLLWGSIVLIECVCLVIICYEFWYQKTHVPVRIQVMPIQKEYLFFPQDTNLKFYSEPKANISKQEDLSYIGISKTITHTFNADGLNERFDYPLEKEKDVFRIVSLGDSFTEGAFVDTKDTYSEVLEDMLNAQLSCSGIRRFEVINLGVEGYDMQYSLERFIRKGEKYHPDLVILWTNENDYTESNEKLGAFAQEYDPDTEAPAQVQMYKDKGDYYPALTVLVEEYFRRHIRQELIDEELGYFQMFATRYTGPLLVFSLETLPADIRETLQLMIQQNPYAYFYPSIPDSYSAFPDYHPSREGHAEFATFLFQKMRTTFFSVCKTR